MKISEVDIEEIEDLLLKVETSFDIRFADYELKDITTFGELCDTIENKVQLENSNDCTTQQAFYKLREALTETFDIKKAVVQPNIQLTELFPRKSRRKRIKLIENKIGIKLGLLRPPYWLTLTLFVVLIISTIGLFVNLNFGLVGLAFSTIGLYFSVKLGNELDLKTLGEVAEKMTRENYKKSRRKSETYNKTEIEKIITELFIHELNINKSDLKRETILI